MKKKWMYFAACGLAILGLTACSSDDASGDKATENGGSDTLVVYSPNSEGLIGATIPAFEEKYGIKVELIQAGTGELFKKLESEKEAPVADVIFGGSYTQYATHGELFENYVSPENENVIKEYQNTITLEAGVFFSPEKNILVGGITSHMFYKETLKKMTFLTKRQIVDSLQQVS